MPDTQTNKSMEQAVGSLTAAVILQQPSDPQAQIDQLASRAKDFSVLGDSIDVRPVSDVTLHLGGQDVNSVTLAAPVDPAQNSDVIDLLKTNGTTINGDDRVVATFVTSRSIDTTETRRHRAPVLVFDEGIAVSVCRESSGETRSFLIDRDGVRAFPVASTTPNKAAAARRKLEKELPPPETLRFDPPGEILAIRDNETLLLPAGVRSTDLTEPSVGPSRRTFHGLQYNQLRVPRRGLEQFIKAQAPTLPSNAAASAAAATVDLKGERVSFLGSTYGISAAIDISKTSPTTTTTHSAGNPADMPTGFADCARAVKRQVCRDCVSARTGLLMSVISGGFVACLTKAGAVGGLVAAIPVWPFTAIGGAATAAVGVAACTIAAGALTAVLLTSSSAAGRECLNDVWVDESTGDVYKQTNKLVTAVSRDSTGRISGLAGPSPDGTIWHLNLDEALELVQYGFPLLVANTNGGFDRICRRQRQGEPYLAATPNKVVADNLGELPVISED